MGHVRPQPGCYKMGDVKEYDGVSARVISTSPEFIKKCEEVGSKPSIRQARDYRRKLGKYSSSNKSSRDLVVNDIG